MYQLNPTSSSADALVLPGVPGVGDYTLALRFVLGDFGGAPAVLLGFDNGGTDTRFNALYFAYWATASESTIQALVDNQGEVVGGSGSVDTSLTSPSVGPVHTLVVVRSGTTVTFWIDGAPVSQVVVPADVEDMAPIWIGCGTNQANFTSASVAQFTMHKAAAADADVAAFAAGSSSLAISGGPAPTYNLPLLSDTAETGGATVTVLGSPSATAAYLVAIAGTGTLALGGTATATLSWAVTPGTSLAIAPTLAGWTFDPPTVTLGAAADATATVTITAPGTASSGPIAWSAAGLPDVDTAISCADGGGSQVATGWPQVLPSGNVFACNFTDGSGNPLNVANVGLGGAFLTVNGTDLPLDGAGIVPMYALDGSSPQTNNVWCPLRGQVPVLSIVDDAAATLTGSWATQAADLTGNDGSTVSATVCVGNSYSTTSGVADTAVYDFTDLVPGEYRVSAVLERICDGTNTTDARYVVASGGSTVATFDVDQSGDETVLTFDRADANCDWTDLGTATIAGTSLTVTLSNHAGAGVLSADAIRVELIRPRVIPAGATVTFTAPSGWAQTTAGPLPAADAVPVVVATDATWFPAPTGTPTGPSIGYNLDTPNYALPMLYVANLIKSAGIQPWNSIWTPSGPAPYTWDADDNITSIPAGTTATAQYIFQSFSGNGVDSRQMLLWAAGDWTIRFRYSGDASDITSGNVAITLIDQSGGGQTIATASGPTFDAGTGLWTIVQNVAYPRRPRGKWAQYNYDLSLEVTNNTGAALGDGTTPLFTAADWTVWDPITTARDAATSGGWTKLSHPALFDRMAGKGFSTIRGLAWLNTNTGSAVDLAQLPQDGKPTYMMYNPYIAAVITAIGPVDLTDANADLALTWNGGAAANVTDGFVRVTTATPHGISDGQFVSLTGPGTIWPNGPGNGSAAAFDASGWTGTDGGSLTLGTIAFVVSPTVFILPVTSSNNPKGSGSPLVTLDTTVTPPAGSQACVAPWQFQNGMGMPLADIIQLAHELGVDPYLNPPYPFTTAAATALGGYLAANCPAGMRPHVELSNEVWNFGPGFWQEQQNLFFQAAAHYAHTQDGSLPDFVGPGTTFHAYRSGQFMAALMSGWTGGGRSAGDLVRILGTQSGNPQATQDYGGTPGVTDHDFIVSDTYCNNGSAYGGPYATFGAWSYDLLDVDDLLDVFGIFLIWGSDRDPLFALHKGYVDAINAANGTSIGLGSYEGGFQDLAMYLYADDAARSILASHAAARSPRAAKALTAWLGHMSQYFDFFTRYALDFGNNLGGGGSEGNDSNWQDYVGGVSPAGIGDGTDGLYDNANPEDQSRVVSALGGAMQRWSAMVKGLLQTYTPATASTGSAGVAQDVTLTLPTAPAGPTSVVVGVTHGSLSAGEATWPGDGATSSVTLQLTPSGTGDPVLTFYPNPMLTPAVSTYTVKLTSARPLTPGTATATAGGPTSIALSATDAGGGASPYVYQWYRGTTAGPLGTAISGATALVDTDTGLSPSTTYYYTLTYTDSEATPVTVASAQVSAKTTASASALVAGTASGSASGATSAKLSATEATGGAAPYSHQWYRGLIPGLLGTAVSGATGLTLADKGLLPITRYYYTLKYIDSAGATAASNQVAVTTPLIATGFALSIAPTPAVAGQPVTTTVATLPTGSVFTGAIALFLDGPVATTSATLNFAEQSSQSTTIQTTGTQGTISVTATNSGGLSDPSPAVAAVVASIAGPRLDPPQRRRRVPLDLPMKRKGGKPLGTNRPLRPSPALDFPLSPDPSRED